MCFLLVAGRRGFFDFRHQLLRDALYRTTPASDRRLFHARAGEFGAQLKGSRRSTRPSTTSAPGCVSRRSRLRWSARETLRACPPIGRPSSSTAALSTTSRRRSTRATGAISSRAT